MKKVITKFIINDRGNSVIMTTGVSFISIMIIVLMATIMGLYINKRYIQNASDSASLAAGKTLSIKYKNELILRREQALQQFWDEVELAAGGQANLESRFIDEKIDSPALRRTLKAHQTPSIIQLNKETRYQPFVLQFSTNSLSELLYDTASRYQVEIFRSAEVYAAKNGALSQVRGIFPADGQPKIRVETRKKVKLPIFDQMLPKDSRYIQIPSASRVNSPDLPSLNLKNKTPVTYDSFN